MFKTIPIFYIIFLLTFVLSAHSKDKTIDIQSKNKILKQELKNIVHRYIRTKEVIDKKQIFTIITNYLIDHHYLRSSVTIEEPNSHTLSFRINNPVQYFFVFKGNQKIDTSVLYSLIDANDFFSSQHISETAINKIQTYYKKKAYHNIEIQTDIRQKLKENKIYIRLNIKEGERFVIQQIRFSGSLSQDSNYYKHLFKNHINSLFNLKHFEEKKVHLYIQSMVYYLRQIGYINAQLYHQDILFNKNKVIIDVILKEGPAVRIKDLTITGNKSIPTEKIKEILQTQKGDILNIIKIQKNVKLIIQLYNDKNFLKATIDQNKIIDINPSLKTALVHIDIKENEISFLKEILVQGNKNIQSDYIRQISNLKKGEKITQEKINQATFFLEDSRLFSIVNIYFTPIKKNSITIKVQESKFGFFRFKFGANTKHRFSTQLNLDINKKNLFGYNRSYFLLNTEFSTNIQLLYNLLNTPLPNRNLFPPSFPLLNFSTYNISTSYVHSYFLNSKFNSKVTYTHKNEIFSLDPRQIEWIRSHKLSFNLDRKFSSASNVNWRIWNIEIERPYTQKFLLNFSSNKNSMETFVHQEQVIAEMGFDVKIDRRDNILFPKKGFYFDFKTDYSNPYIGAYDNIHFVSTEIKSRYYLSLKRVVFAHAINGGLIQNLGNGQVPVRRYFILGGLNSLRGFDGKIRGDRIPRASEFPIDSPVETKPFSSYYFLLKQEIRFPIYGDFLNGALFYDAGGVVLFSEKMKSIFSFGHSVGVGIHSMTTLGPLVINIGFKIKPRSLENIFHLNWAMGAF